MSTRDDAPQDLTETLADTPLASALPSDTQLTPALPSNAQGPSLNTDSLGAASWIDSRYEIVGLLGTGGMGNVYRVFDHTLQEEVALKVLRQDIMTTDKIRRRFIDEARLARRVTHYNVARTFDLGEYDGRLYITMEYIKGASLSATLKQQPGFKLARLLPIAQQICEGLQAAHRVQVIHRDLKPDNILLGEEQRVVLTDFGIASLLAREGDVTSTRGLVGTPAYLSPEQAMGEAKLTEQTDIYALGLVLFEMATGVRAWPGEELFAVVNARLFHEPPDPRTLRPKLPQSFADLVRKCMAKEPSERYTSIGEVLEGLKAIQTGESSPSLTNLPLVAQMPQAPDTPAYSLRPEFGFEKSLAVLPFRNAGSEEDAFLVEGFVEDLIDTLSMTQHLKVRPWGMVAPYAGQDVSMEEAAAALEVEVLVTGSLRKRGEQLQLRVRAFSVEEKFQLWAKKIQGDQSAFLSLSDEVAEAIADALAVAPVQEKRKAAHDPKAIELYFKGRQEMRQSWYTDLSQAVELFQQALTLSPNDPMILSGLAIAQARRAYYGEQPIPLDLASQLAKQAISLAPHRAEPHCAMGFVYFAQTEIGKAASCAQQAISRISTYVEAHDLLGRIFSETGPISHAISHLETATQLASNAHHTQRDLIRCYLFTDQVERADQLIQASFADQLDEYTRHVRAIEYARFALWCRRPEWLQDDIHIQPFAGGIEACRELLLTGQFREAYKQSILDVIRLRASQRSKLVMWQILSEAYAMIGEVEDAVEAIEGSVENGLWDLVWLESCPLFTETFQTHPRFQGAKDKVKERIEAWFQTSPTL